MHSSRIPHPPSSPSLFAARPGPGSLWSRAQTHTHNRISRRSRSGTRSLQHRGQPACGARGRIRVVQGQYAVLEAGSESLRVSTRCSRPDLSRSGSVLDALCNRARGRTDGNLRHRSSFSKGDSHGPCHVTKGVSSPIGPARPAAVPGARRPIAFRRPQSPPPAPLGRRPPPSVSGVARAARPAAPWPPPGRLVLRRPAGKGRMVQAGARR